MFYVFKVFSITLFLVGGIDAGVGPGETHHQWKCEG